MKSFISLSGAVTLLGSAAIAQTAPDVSRLQAASRMLAAMHYEETLNANHGDPQAIVSGVATDCARDHVSGQVCQTRVDEAKRIAAAAVKSRAAIVPQAVEAARVAYASYLSTEELDQIAAFYSSPAGKRLLSERPAIDAEIRAAQGRIVLDWLATVGSKAAQP